MTWRRSCRGRRSPTRPMAASVRTRTRNPGRRLVGIRLNASVPIHARPIHMSGSVRASGSWFHAGMLAFGVMRSSAARANASRRASSGWRAAAGFASTSSFTSTRRGCRGPCHSRRRKWGCNGRTRPTAACPRTPPCSGTLGPSIVARRPVVAELRQHRRLRGAGKRLADVVGEDRRSRGGRRVRRHDPVAGGVMGRLLNIRGGASDRSQSRTFNAR